jgi:hypothetical protein
MKKIYTLFVFLVVAQVAFAVTRRVNNNSGYVAAPPLLYTDLTAAYNDANNDDVIIIEPSPNSYGWPSTIAKKLNYVGNGAFLSDHPGLQVNLNYSTLALFNTPNLATGAAGSTFAGITFVSNGAPLILRASNISFTRCYFSVNAGVNAQEPLSGLLFQSCYFENYTIDLNDASSQTGVLVTNCAFRSGGINLSASDDAIIENCNFGWSSSGTLDLGNNSTVLANVAVTNCIIRSLPVNYANSMFTNCIFNELNFTGQGNFYMPTTFNNLFSNYNASNDNAFLLAVANTFSYTDNTGALTNQPNPAINTGVFGSGDDRGCYNDGTNRPTWKPAGIPAVPSIYSLLGGGIVSGNTVNITISTRGNN